ncbi:hypothetical protein B0H13DRAFT_1853255 [Mycena leptocephala]|nr:hypothetical protein B0H13DRAFT_1853255 [Mycena leptocephala]
MGPRADSPGDSGNESDASDIPENAPNSFSKPETNHALDFLLKDPSQYLSGNGFKTKSCTDISASLKKKFPARPIRSKEVVRNRLRYVIMNMVLNMGARRSSEANPNGDGAPRQSSSAFAEIRLDTDSYPYTYHCG